MSTESQPILHAASTGGGDLPASLAEGDGGGGVQCQPRSVIRGRRLCRGRSPWRPFSAQPQPARASLVVCHHTENSVTRWGGMNVNKSKLGVNGMLMCVYVHACVRACVHACLPACVCVCMLAHVHMCVPACVYSILWSSIVAEAIL